MSEILNILGSVGFNWHVALANFVNFLIILFLLNVFFFKKLGKTLKSRHDVIERGLNQAREAELSLLRAEEEKAVILKSAHKEKHAILEDGEKKAQELAALLTSQAEEGIQAKLHSLNKKEEDLVASLEKAFKEKAPSLVASLYKESLMRNMTKEENDALIASMKA
jgi:F0F1-type ATP synthase membrane subunit b/b'